MLTLLRRLGERCSDLSEQPFWAIPLFAIANLRARDVIGYTTVAMPIGLGGGWLTLFLGVL